MEDQTCAELVRNLLANPLQFYNDGRAYVLLQAFFDGEPLETLRPLLRSDVNLVQRSAMFVTSELGRNARGLIDDIIPLLYSSDRYLKYYAMEVLTVCCDDDQAPKFALVVQMLESEDEVLRTLAMNLLSRTDISQIEAARSSSVSPVLSSDSHVRGLRALAAGQDIHPTIISAMIESFDPLIRRYGAIAAKRLSREFPALMKEVDASKDTDLQTFSERDSDSHDRT